MAAPAPDIVLTITDTQPRPFIGAYAGVDRGTPHLDALAAAGTRFERCYTSSPLCTPARAGLFTGMTPSRAGAYTNSQPLGLGVLSLGERLTAAGRRCAYIGKWHLDGHDYFGSGTCPPGWEDAFWYDGKRYLLDLSPDEVRAWRTDWSTLDGLRTHGVRAGQCWAHRIADRAERFCAEQVDDRPCFLVASFDEPHHPWTCPPAYAERFLDPATGIDLGPAAFDDLAGKPAHQRVWAGSFLGVASPDGRWHHPLMQGCNSFVDAEIGRVVAAARAMAARRGRPLWLLHTSDHGDHLGTHRLRNKGPTGYELNLGVPLIVVAPDAAPAVQPSVVSHLDLAPSLLALAGASAPPCLDGASLLPLVGHGRRDDARTAFAEYTRYEVGHDGFGGFEPLRVLVRWPWKLVINLFQDDELYHLADDPHELRNRIADPACAGERDRMHDALLAWMDAHVDPWRGRPWQERPWRRLAREHWRSPLRPVANDGAMPPYIDYDTGLPTRGVAVQYS